MSDSPSSFPFLPDSVARVVDSSRAQTRADEIAAQRGNESGGAVDPDYAPDSEFFDGMSHQTIYDNSRLMEPGELAARADSWRATSVALDGMLLGFRLKMGSLIGQGWEGEAAKASKDAVDAFIVSGQSASTVMGSVVSRLNQASSAAEAVRAAVPQPENVDLLTMMPMALLNPPSAAALAEAQKRAEEARQEAIRAMNNIYKPTMIPVGNGVPAFSAPTDPTNGGAGAPGGGGSANGGGGAGFGGFGSGAGSAPGGGANSAGGQSDSAASSGVGADGQQVDTAGGQDSTAAASAAGQNANSAAGGLGSGAAGAGAGQGAAAQTSAASAPGDSTAGVLGRPVGIGGSTGAGGGAAGAGGAGGGYGGAGGLGSAAARRRDEQKTDGSNGLGVGAIGGGVGGALAGSDTVRSGPSVAAGATAAARSGPAGGGMMPHGRNEKGDEDSEHKTPSYLINVDNGNELVGDMQPAAPPVLGVWEHE